MSNVPKHHRGGAMGHRLDVRRMMSHYLAPFQAADKWRETLATIDRNRFGIQRDVHGGLIALHEWSKPSEKKLAVYTALAMRKAWVSQKFPPTVSEMLELCKKHQANRARAWKSSVDS